MCCVDPVSFLRSNRCRSKQAASRSPHEPCRDCACPGAGFVPPRALPRGVWAIRATREQRTRAFGAHRPLDVRAGFRGVRQRLGLHPRRDRGLASAIARQTRFFGFGDRLAGLQPKLQPEPGPRGRGALMKLSPRSLSGDRCGIRCSKASPSTRFACEALGRPDQRLPRPGTVVNIVEEPALAG